MGRTAAPSRLWWPACSGRWSTTRRSTRERSTGSTGSSPRRGWPRPGSASPGRRRSSPASALDSYAYLEDDLIEAKIVDELRDHPLLLLPRGKRRGLIEERLGGEEKRGIPTGLPAHQRRSLAPQPADLRGAALLVSRRHRQGPAPRPGRTFLRLPAVSAGGGHRGAPAGGGRPVAAAHHGPLALLAAARAAVPDPLRGAGRAGRREPRAARLRRPAEASARVLQVPARHGRAGSSVDGRGGPGDRHRLHRLLERGLPGRLQGAPRVPVVQGPHGAGARALPARLPAGAEDLRGAHQFLHRHRRQQTRRAPRALGHSACGRCSRA